MRLFNNLPPQILMEALQISLTEAYHLRELTPEQGQKIELATWAYKNRIPLARVFGRKFFWKDAFQVSPFTLEPRPETEVLVNYVKTRLRPNSILDLGTGTGCILLSLLRECPQAYGLGIDISPYAIAAAKQNSLNLNRPADFMVCDFSEVVGKFDLIISNPPYVRTECEFEALFDPPISLWDKNFYPEIIHLKNLNLQASIILEVPAYSSKEVEELAEKKGLLIIKEKISPNIVIYELKYR